MESYVGKAQWYLGVTMQEVKKTAKASPAPMIAAIAHARTMPATLTRFDGCHLYCWSAERIIFPFRVHDRKISFSSMSSSLKCLRIISSSSHPFFLVFLLGNLRYITLKRMAKSRGSTGFSRAFFRRLRFREARFLSTCELSWVFTGRHHIPQPDCRPRNFFFGGIRTSVRAAKGLFFPL